MKSLKPILFVLTDVVLAVALPNIWRELGLIGHWERIQILETKDHAHTAKLYRLYGYIDVNFRIILDGKRIYWSPDCAPDYTLPFGETLAWDTTGKIILFRLAGETVFAYDISTGRSLAPKDFTNIQMPSVTLDNIGFEGRHQLRQELEK